MYREEFDEEKEPDGMLLSGWTAPTDKERVVNSNGEGTSTAALQINETEEVDIASDRHGLVAGTKRKLSELAETTDRQEIQPTLSKHISRLEVPEDVGDNDDDDDVVMLDENPEKGKNKRLK